MRTFHCSIHVMLYRSAVVLLTALCLNVCAQPVAPVRATGLIPLPAPNGNFIVMPLKRAASRSSGLQLFVDTRWVNGYGYRPVGVTISASKPTTADHSITIQLHCGWETEISVEQAFDIPLGSTQATTNVAVPIFEQSVHNFWWDVWIDGVKDVDLSVDKTEALRQWGLTNTSTTNVRVLKPGDDSNVRTLVSTNSADFEALSLKLADFPQRWIDYTCFDVVALSQVELQSIAHTNQAGFEALERWVRAGGQLWVTDVGSELDGLQRVSKLLHLPDAILEVAPNSSAKPVTDERGDKPAVATTDRPAQVGWAPFEFRRGIRRGQPQGFTDRRTGNVQWVADPEVVARLERDPNYVKSAGPATAPGGESSRRWWAADSGNWFVEQQLGLGRVRAFRGTNENDWFVNQAAAVAANATQNESAPHALAMALRTTRHWDVRHGLIPDGGNSEFAKLLVPGVGQAPVTEFQVLITLFVLAIGPLNYWILKRYKRLQLLVLTVPLAAIVATAGLFAYAIVSDGFATNVRVRSFTTLDQRTGEAACWARLSYYSGMAPGQGLMMPADVVVYPMLPSWGNESAGNRAMIWSKDKEQLARGWLNSRTPTQYLELRSRKTPYRLDVSAGNGKMRVTNRLGTKIESLIATDQSGKFFAGEQLANDSRLTLQPISRDDAVKLFAGLVRKNEPEAPPALAGSDRGFSARRSRIGRSNYGRYGQQFGEDPPTDNLARGALSDLAGLNGQPALELPPKSYVAITATGPEVATGISYALEVASFHVIVGQW